MRHRIFIAINLPEDIKKKLSFFQSKWPELPCRWTKKENLHITLEFLGYLTDEELIELFQKTKEITSGKRAFNIHLNKICYGPPNKKLPRPPKFLELTGLEEDKIKPPQKFGWPRMVWVVGEKIKEFNFTPHITLGRIKVWEFKQIEPEERPEINEDISLSFEVNSIEVMESQLKRGGARYTILESCLLSK